MKALDRKLLRDTPGVADVQTTIEQIVRIELPDVADPIIGLLIGVDSRQAPRMNRITLQSGRPLDEARLSDNAIPGGAFAGMTTASRPCMSSRRTPGARRDPPSAHYPGSRPRVEHGVALSPAPE